jgi:ureidoacrylate peracid hydrolase
MQNDFGSEGGLFQRAGIDIAGIREVIAPIRRVSKRARAKVCR